MRYTLLTVAAWLAVSGHALAQDKATIQKLVDNLTSALNAGDAETVAAIYAEEAYLLPPGAVMVQGRENIKTFWAKSMPTFDQAKLTTADVMSSGDFVREIGSFSVKMEGDQPQQRSGKYLIICEKAGGEWHIDVDIWNFDQ